MAQPSTPIRRFFRIVDHSPPTVDDFKSYKALGIPLIDPRREELYDGVSVWNTDMQAWRRAAKKAQPKYVSILDVPADGSVRFARTTSQAGHHTIWASPETLLGYVKRTVAVPV